MAPFRASVKYKITSLVGYLGLSLSGIFSVVFPPAAFTNTTSLVLAIIWASMLGLGGFLGAWGVLRNRRFPEAVGLPILASTLAAFGFIILFRAVSSQAVSARGSILFGALLFAFSGMLVARGFELGFDKFGRRRDGR